MNPFIKLLNWYFSKESLPYWCLLLADSVIVFLSGIFTYWGYNRTLEMFNHRFAVLYTTLLYVIISWVGARMFRTYLGVVRYSSFVDLMKVAYANIVSIVIAVAASLLFEHLDIKALSALSRTETIISFLIATLLMWGIRVVVKTLHDVSRPDSNAMRTLIYGAMTSGIGLAKNIRSQTPRKFQLCGFISNNNRAQHMTLKP
jgi:FlaA1/EpsC-like NDP-sugar epimerase